jgi:hypothetical protein
MKMSKEFNWPNPPDKAADNVPTRMTSLPRRVNFLLAGIAVMIQFYFRHRQLQFKEV